MLVHGFFFLAALAVKQDQTPLRSGCEAGDETIATLAAGTTVEVRFRVADHTRVNRKQRWRLPDRRRKHPKSERPQISHHPGGPCNEESQAEFGPVQMRFWVSDQTRNPDQHTKECQHEGHQAYRKPCLAIDENSDRRERKRDSREDSPKPLTWRNPRWNHVRCHRKVEHLTQRK